MTALGVTRLHERNVVIDYIDSYIIYDVVVPAAVGTSARDVPT